MVRNMVSEERIKTNLLLTDYLDYWDELSVKSINDEWTLRYYNHIMNLLNSQVDEAVKWLDSEDAKELFYEEAEYQSELFRSLEDEWDEILEQKYPSVEALLDEVYRRGKSKGYAEMREHIRFTDTDKLALDIVRNYNFHLISKLDNDTRNQIKNIITSAVLSGENPRSVAPKIRDTVGTRLEGSTFTPTQRAVMIARTEVSRAQNTGILQSYVNEGYTEVKILTAEDSNVCYTCLSYAYEFNKDTPIIFENRGKEKIHNIMKLLKGGSFPPFHPNCRCTYLSIWKTKGEPPKDPFVLNLVPNIINICNLEYDEDPTKFVEFDGDVAYGVGESLQDKLIFEMLYGVSIYDFPINSPELKLIKLYSGDGFKYLNKYFRKIKGATNPQDLVRIKEECERDWNLELLDDENYISFDEAIEASRTVFNFAKVLEKDLVVVRRQDKSMLIYADDGIYYNDAFMSTSISGEIYKYGDYVNLIRIPKGTKILYIEGVTLEENEYEVLLPPDIELHLVDEISEKLLKWTL